MLKLLGLLLLISMIALGVNRATFSDQAAELSVTPVPSSQTAIRDRSVYSIQAFREREFQTSALTVERTVRETDQFISYLVSYDSDGLQQNALMNLPKSDQPANGYPVVIVNHGYIDPAVYSTTGNYTNTSAFYATQGFAVLKPDYRGHDQSEGEAGTFFSRINYAVDVIHLIKAIESRTDLDSNNVFAYGHSMGGDVTLRVLESTQLLRAVSLWAPAVTDFPENQLYFARRNNQQGRYERYLQELQATLTEAQYDSVSTMKNLDAIQVPILIHHGTRDESVPYDWGLELYDQLVARGKSATLHTYTGDNHDIAGNFSKALMRDVDFFRQHLVAN